VKIWNYIKKSFLKFFIFIFSFLLLLFIFLYIPFLVNKQLIKYYSLGPIELRLEDVAANVLSFSKDKPFDNVPIKDVPEFILPVNYDEKLIAEKLKENLHEKIDELDRLNYFSNIGSGLIRYKVNVNNNINFDINYKVSTSTDEILHHSFQTVIPCEKEINDSGANLLSMDNGLFERYVEKFRELCINKFILSVKNDLDGDIFPEGEPKLNGTLELHFTPDFISQSLSYIIILVVWTGFVTYFVEKFIRYVLKINKYICEKLKIIHN